MSIKDGKHQKGHASGVPFTFNGKEYWIDPIVKSNLDVIKGMLKKDFDCTIVIDGPERAGKSTFGQTICAYLDPTFNLDRVVFTPEEWERLIVKLDEFQANMFDEGAEGFYVRNAMADVNKRLNQIMMMVGQKNLITVIILPSFFDLDKYIAIWRSTILFHVMIRFRPSRKWGVAPVRGHFSYYNRKKKKVLYLYGKKGYNYNITPPTARGYFFHNIILDDIKYRKKKWDSLKSVLSSIDETLPDGSNITERDRLIEALKKRGANKTEIVRETGIRKSVVDKALSKTRQRKFEGMTVDEFEKRISTAESQ